MLRDKYKAIDKLLENVASRFNGRLFQENNTMFSYILPVYTFGVHVGDNLVIVEEKHLGCLFRIESKLGSQLIVQTSSTDYMNEFLPIITCNEIINEVLFTHTQKPQYIEFCKGNSNRKIRNKSIGQESRGCMSIFIFIIICIFLKAILI